MVDLSTLDARKALAGKYAAKYSLDPALVCALIEQESSWNPWAMRYEPMFFTHYIQPMLNDGRVQNITEATARATSYGLCQVMGQVAREQAFTGRFLSELCDPDVGIEYGCRKLSSCLKSTGGDVQAALQKYNGGGDLNYGIDVMARVYKYK